MWVLVLCCAGVVWFLEGLGFARIWVCYKITGLQVVASLLCLFLFSLLLNLTNYQDECTALDLCSLFLVVWLVFLTICRKQRSMSVPVLNGGYPSRLTRLRL